MRKILSLLLAVIMIFALVSCGGTTSPNTTSPNINKPVTTTDSGDAGDFVPEATSGDGLLVDTQWYGWWMVADPTGDYEDYDGAYFDCCVSFEKTNEGYTLMSIWDEVFTDYENECLGEIYFEEIEGRLVSVEGGFFFTGETVGKEQVIIDPEFTEYENTLFTIVDVKDESGSFVAAINLTEWGCEWNEDFNDYPTYYDSYFLPLMEEGKALPKDISDIG